MNQYPKIVLYVRRARKYFNGEINFGEGRDRAESRNFKKAMHGWKMFFKMDYYHFRHRLAQIAYQSYLPNRFDQIIFWDDWDVIKKFGEDTWVIPIDEDDWISPDLVAKLREEISEEKQLITWQVFYTTQEGIARLEKNRSLYRSCCYSFRMPCHTVFLRYNVALANNAARRQRYRIEVPLAVKLDNISSLCAMYTIGSRWDLVLKTVQNRYLLHPSNLPEEYVPYVQQYNELLIDLYDSCKIKWNNQK